MIRYRYNLTILKDSVGLKCIGYIPVQLDPNKKGVSVQFFYCHVGKNGLNNATSMKNFQNMFDNIALPQEDMLQ